MSRRPEIVESADGARSINLGTIVSGLILAALLAGGSALVTVGVLVVKAEAAEGDIKKVEEDVARQGRNQIKLDENQRRIRQDTEHANAKLDKLLQALEVSERVPRPPLPPASLEEPKEAE